MKTFHCDRCGNLLFFENIQCVNCGHYLGFLPEVMDLSTLRSLGDGIWQPVSPLAKGQRYRNCANALPHKACNWLVPADSRSPFCAACELNLVIPDLSVPENVNRWRKLEQAKRRVLFTLFRLGLSTRGNAAENRPPLRFQFLSDAPDKPVLTGHCQGMITVNIAEADDDERERRRLGMHEPYRTLIGHLRHEVGHYYWDHLIANSSRLADFQRIFGDETRDYGASLKAYYHKGPPTDWHRRFVSAYASSHPWEDWAETWAHYLHMVDTLETAANFGITLNFQGASRTAIASDPAQVADRRAGFDQILKNWMPLTTAVNSLNRAMGLPDLYPFIVPEAAIEKLKFIHEVVHAPMPVPAAVAKAPVPQPQPRPTGAHASELVPVAA